MTEPLQVAELASKHRSLTYHSALWPPLFFPMLHYQGRSYRPCSPMKDQTDVFQSTAHPHHLLPLRTRTIHGRRYSILQCVAVNGCLPSSLQPKHGYNIHQAIAHMCKSPDSHSLPWSVNLLLHQPKDLVPVPLRGRQLPQNLPLQPFQ